MAQMTENPRTTASTDAVCVQSLSKLFLTKSGTPVRAISNVSMTIGRGEKVAILGPSGCGKSTLLRILGGLDKHYRGSVEWASDESEAGRLRTATVFQQDSTLPWRDVAANVELGLSRLHLPKSEVRSRVEQYTELVGLEKFRNAYPHELSGGMKQRVSIARALACRPSVLLMDEPLAALDAQTRIVMQSELSSIWRSADSTVVYVTHDIEEAITLADRVVVMTARPGEIRSIRTVKVPRKRAGSEDYLTPLEFRADPSFGLLALELWADLATPSGDAEEVAS